MMIGCTSCESISVWATWQSLVEVFLLNLLIDLVDVHHVIIILKVGIVTLVLKLNQ